MNGVEWNHVVNVAWVIEMEEYRSEDGFVSEESRVSRANINFDLLIKRGVMPWINFDKTFRNR